LPPDLKLVANRGLIRCAATIGITVGIVGEFREEVHMRRIVLGMFGATIMLSPESASCVEHVPVNSRAGFDAISAVEPVVWNRPRLFTLT
jgi:hypothetical protein